MKFRGKVDLWFWAVMLFGDVLMFGAVFTPGLSIVMIISFIVYNVIFIPLVARNYVEISDDMLTVVCGFSKDSIGILEIQEVYRTNNPVASSAASLDRIVIKGRQKMLMCAVKERDKFFSYLEEKNPAIKVNRDKKGKGFNLASKIGVGFMAATFLLVGIFLLTGDVEIEYADDSFVIKASYWYDKEIEYAEIEHIEYIDEKVSGARTGGVGTFRLLLGDFNNEEYGNYTRYTYADCDAGVVLLVKDREVVISGKDKESTKAIYEELLKRCEAF